MITTERIKNLIPHREPMLFVEHIDTIEIFKHISMIKTYKKENSEFQGHFPHAPILPGIFIIETLAQMAAILVAYSLNRDDLKPYLISLNNVKFRKPVVPDQTALFDIKILRRREEIFKFKGVVSVDGALVHEAEFLAGFS